MMKRKMQSKRLNKTVSANRRKRMLANNKKKIIWRNRTYTQLLLD
ncbi:MULTISPECIES: hypothetical protein [Vibrio]|nr:MULTISPECIES: hypothetical protein [Vibrio]WGW01050.1 hypothetical protein QF117_09580 [Vibrio sp. YMD68]